MLLSERCIANHLLNYFISRDSDDKFLGLIHNTRNFNNGFLDNLHYTNVPPPKKGYGMISGQINFISHLNLWLTLEFCINIMIVFRPHTKIVIQETLMTHLRALYVIELTFDNLFAYWRVCFAPVLLQKIPTMFMAYFDMF